MKLSALINSKNLYILSGVLLVIALFGWQDYLLLRGEEPRRAVVSLEMLLTGEYIVPHIDGWPYYNKPPLFNWLMAGSFKIFGVNNWAVRFPALIGLLSTSVFTYFFVKKYLSKEIAIITAFMALTCGDLLFFACVFSGEIDMFYAFLTVVQVAAIFHFYNKKNLLLLFVFSYLFASLGFLTKALPSVLFQAFTLLALAITYKDFRFLFSWKHLIGFGVFILIVGGYLLVFDQKDDAIGFLMRQTKEAAEKSAVEASTQQLIKSFLIFPFQFLKIMLPWSLIVFIVLKKSVRAALKNNKLIWFSILFILLNIPIYWISNYFKARYLYMFIPFAMMILVYALCASDSKFKEVLKRIFTGVIYAFPLITLAALIYLWGLTPINNFILKGAALLMGSVFCVFIVRKLQSPFKVMILVLVVARLGWNFFYLPNHFANSTFETFQTELSTILRESGEEQIFLYGKPHVFNSKVDLKFIEIEKALTTAPQLQFRIPFYISAAKNQVLLFEEELKPNRYYLMKETDKVVSSHIILGKVFDNFSDKYWVLIHTEKQ